MTTPKARLAGLALIAALCAGFILGLTAPASAGLDEGVAAYKRGDYATALREWRPLAKQGYAKAQYNLGLMYARGHGVPQDFAKALQWYRNAALQGDAQAQHNLAIMYRNGEGVTQDYVQAYMWLNIAALKARKGLSKRSREKLRIIRDDLAKKMTPAQKSEAQKLAREWKPKK